ncbi:MAG TPA: hypothetical protein VFQ53_19345 [Kofleriaceae bacterium]|nr:hypothetical protein [Kofleriaceae bacterium]
MSQPNIVLINAPPVPDESSWTDEVEALLDKAAELAAQHGIESDDFMRAAWGAFLDARPGLREEIEDKQLRAELRKLRKRGLVAAA